MRGYVGAPIVLGDGRVFGTFCAVDSEPMNLDGEQIAAMASLATLVSYAIDVERLATHDLLTGLYNKSLFDDHLLVELARARRNNTMLAVLSIDLDDFEPVNDLHRRELGDQVLASVGTRLRSTIRLGDTAARLGGDEFALILPDIRKIDDAKRVATAVLESLEDPIVAGGEVFTISACVGVAVYPMNGPDGAALMQSADAAMLEAKAAGVGMLRLSPYEASGVTADSGHVRPRLRVLPDDWN